MSVTTNPDTPAPDPWGGHATTYDRTFAPLTGHIARNLLALLEPQLVVGARVLDIACGSGALLIPAIERAERQRAAGSSDHVVGCDYSKGMVDVARRKAGVAHDPGAFRCDVENGQSLGYEDHSFDAALSCFGIFLFEDRQAGWREAARVLVPGGLFATTSWMAPEHNEMFRAQFEPVMEALPPRLREGMTPPSWMMVAEADGLKDEVSQAGFVDVEVRPFHSDFVLPSIEDAWGAILDNPQGGSLLAQCDAAELDAIREHFSARLTERAGGPARPLVVRASCNMLIARTATKG